VDRSIIEPENFIQTNIVGTFNLLEACRGAWAEHFDGKRFQHTSTDEVYGSLGPTGRFTETTPYAPNSPTQPAKHPVISWYGLIIAPMACPQSSRILQTITGRFNFRKS